MHSKSLLLLTMALILVASGFAREKKLKKSELPSAVQTAVDEQSHGATVTGFSSDRKNGIQVYEANMTVDRHSKDITMDSCGKIIEVEEEVRFDNLPQEVQRGIQHAAGAKEIVKVESIVKDGKLVAYEAVLLKMARHSEIQVGPDGSKLKHEE